MLLGDAFERWFCTLFFLEKVFASKELKGYPRLALKISSS
jgi:hypothetical protein